MTPHSGLCGVSFLWGVGHQRRLPSAEGSSRKIISQASLKLNCIAIHCMSVALPPHQRCRIRRNGTDKRLDSAVPPSARALARLSQPHLRREDPAPPRTAPALVAATLRRCTRGPPQSSERQKEAAKEGAQAQATLGPRAPALVSLRSPARRTEVCPLRAPARPLAGIHPRD